MNKALLFFFASALSVMGADLTGTFYDSVDNPVRGAIVFRPLSTPYSATNPAVRVTRNISVNLTNGSFATPLAAGAYDVLVGSDRFQIWVPTNAGPFDVTTLATNLTGMTITIPVGGVLLSQLMAATNHLYSLFPYVVAGTNVSVLTNNVGGLKSYTISSTGDGGGSVTSTPSPYLIITNENDQAIAFYVQGDGLPLDEQSRVHYDLMTGLWYSKVPWIFDGQGLTNLNADRLVQGQVALNLLSTNEASAGKVLTASSATEAQWAEAVSAAQPPSANLTNWSQVETNALLDVPNVEIVINVKDSPGSTDLERLQYALDQTTNTTTYGGPSIVKIPAGTYTINGTLKVRSHGTTIRGDGPRRTKILQQSDTANTFIYDGTWSDGVIWGGTNAQWHLTVEDLQVSKTIVDVSLGASAAFFFGTYADGVPSLFRAKFSNVLIEGFYYGLKVNHCVGLLCERVEAYDNNYAFWLEKADSATFINCHAGQANNNTTGVNKFGATNSVAWYYHPNTYGPGFNLHITGGESRSVATVVDANYGSVTVRNMNVELLHQGPGFYMRSNVYSAQFDGIRCVGRMETNLYPIFKFDFGVGPRAFIGGGLLADLSAAPTIELNGVDDWINYWGRATTVTNVASTSSYLVSKLGVLRAGSSVTITTNAPYDWTISSTGEFTDLPPGVITNEYAIPFSVNEQLTMKGGKIIFADSSNVPFGEISYGGIGFWSGVVTNLTSPTNYSTYTELTGIAYPYNTNYGQFREDRSFLNGVRFEDNYAYAKGFRNYLQYGGIDFSDDGSSISMGTNTVFNGATNHFDGDVGFSGVLAGSNVVMDVLEFDSVIGTLYGTNIAAGSIDTNHLTAEAYEALAGGGTVDNPIDGYAITNAPYLHGTNMVLVGDGTNYLGATTISNSFAVTGTGTNSLGFTTITNVGTSKYLYQGTDGVIVGADVAGGEATNVLHTAAGTGITVTTNDLLYTVALSSPITGEFSGTVSTLDATNSLQSTGFDPVLLSAGGDSELVVAGSVTAISFAGSGASLTGIPLATAAAHATNLWGTIGTNNISGAPTTGYVPKVQAGGTVEWAADSTGEGVFDPDSDYVWTGSNVFSGPVVMTAADTNRLGYTTFTNASNSKFLYQGSDGIVVGVDITSLDGAIITNAPSITATNITARGTITGTFTTTDATNTYVTTGFDPVSVSAGGDSELVVAGTITASGFSGSGANLTSLAPTYTFNTTEPAASTTIDVSPAKMYQLISTNAAFAIGGFSNIGSSKYVPVTLEITNSSASAFAVTFPAGVTFIGNTNALTVSAGKEAFVSILIRPARTNVIITTEYE